MTENISFCSPEIVQRRMEWNLVLRLAKDLSEEAKEARIDPHQIVLVGGFATFLHTKEALGNKVVNFWRGTHDVDLVITQRGGTGMLLAGLQESGNYQYIDSARSHFINKQTWNIQNKPKGYLLEKQRDIDIDVYFLDKDRNSVDFNGRFISPYPNNFITEPVNLVNILNDGKINKIAIPSVTDLILMKLDIIKFSAKLRDKDKNDILSLLMVAEKRGLTGVNILTNTLKNIKGDNDKKLATEELNNLFTSVIQCYKSGKIPLDRKIFLPSEEYIRKSRDVLTSENLGKMKRVIRS